MLSLICALARNRVIGRDGDLPWRLPDDMAHFKRTTLDKPVVMGRRTWESLGRALPRRRNVVVSRSGNVRGEGFERVGSLDAALVLCADAPEVVVIGGAALYAEALERVERMYLTYVDADVEGDVTFPEFDVGRWREVAREEHAADARHAYAFAICTLEPRVA